jgi:hypothetical protein
MEFSLEFFATIGHLMTGFGTVFLVIMLLKTFKHLDAATRMSKVETEYRLRPWVGPSTGIKKVENSINGKIQFSITLKNFGELPASGLKAKSMVDTKMLSRDSLKQLLTEFDLGPLLPNMEKSYWFFVEPEVWNKITNGNETLFTALYFEYPSLTGKNGYGMISEYNKKNDSFVHKEMWIDHPEIKF